MCISKLETIYRISFGQVKILLHPTLPIAYMFQYGVVIPFLLRILIRMRRTRTTLMRLLFIKTFSFRRKSASSVVSPFEAVVSCKDAKTRKSGNDHVTGTTIYNDMLGNNISHTYRTQRLWQCYNYTFY